AEAPDERRQVEGEHVETAEHEDVLPECPAAAHDEQRFQRRQVRSGEQRNLQRRRTITARRVLSSALQTLRERDKISRRTDRGGVDRDARDRANVGQRAALPPLVDEKSKQLLRRESTVA